MARIILVSVLLLMLLHYSSGIKPFLFTQVLQAIDNVLDFLDVNAEEVLPDMLFGVAVAKGQLNGLRNNMKMNLNSKKTELSGWNSIFQELEFLEQKCQKILNDTENCIILKDDEAYNKMVREIIRPERWERVSIRRKLRRRFSNTKDINFPYVTSGSVVAEQWASLWRGEPQDERTSDACLAEAVQMTSAPACRASPACYQERLQTRGYTLTHRLLYAQVARQAGCKFVGFLKSVDDLVNDYCADILMDAELIERLNFPIYARDMFCEQVALCGFEGFQEFTQPEWINRILSWQRPIGCFGDKRILKTYTRYKEYKRARSRSKRSEKSMAFGCLMHATSVATAALAVSLNSLMDIPISAA